MALQFVAKVCFTADLAASIALRPYLSLSLCVSPSRCRAGKARDDDTVASALARIALELPAGRKGPEVYGL